MNDEDQDYKTGLIGEYLVKIRLNEYEINTGSVDKDTGTDIVMFQKNRILTAQVKTGINDWNYAEAHGVHVHFQVKLNRKDKLQLDASEIRWKRIDIPDNGFKDFNGGSIGEMFK